MIGKFWQLDAIELLARDLAETNAAYACARGAHPSGAPRCLFFEGRWWSVCPSCGAQF